MFHTHMFYPLKTRQLGQLQMCILDHVAIFLRVEKYMLQGLVDNFPKVIRQINSAEQNVLLIRSGILRLTANSSQFVNATSQEHRCINSR